MMAILFPPSDHFRNNYRLASTTLTNADDLGNSNLSHEWLCCLWHSSGKFYEPNEQVGVCVCDVFIFLMAVVENGFLDFRSHQGQFLLVELARGCVYLLHRSRRGTRFGLHRFHFQPIGSWNFDWITVISFIIVIFFFCLLIISRTVSYFVVVDYVIQQSNWLIKCWGLRGNNLLEWAVSSWAFRGFIGIFGFELCHYWFS